MLSPLGPRFARALLIILLCAQFVLTVPQPASAAPLTQVTVHFDVVSVVRDASVTIRTRDFPVRTKFTVRIDKVGKWAKNGPVVGELNTESGGVLEATFSLPKQVLGQRILAIRMDSVDGYTADNWFFNRTQNSPLYASVQKEQAKNQPVKTPELNFSGVKKNESVTLVGANLPANTSMGVRMGPYDNFYQKYVTLESIQSSADGSLNAIVSIPAALKDVEHIMVRLDGGGKTAIRIFKNVTGGSAVSEQSLIKVIPCTVVNIAPVPELAPGEDFDAVWTVQNTAPWDWKADSINYRFNGGEPMHKYYKDVYGIGPEIKRGWTFDIAIDMIAPDTPGWHKTQWALVLEETENIYCTLNISVFVHE